MLVSMTGYATKSFEVEGQKFNLEIKSYNHKYLDISFKTHRSFSFLENIIKKEINHHIKRGRVEIILNVEESPIEKYLNPDRAKLIYNLVKDIKKELKLKEEISFSDILTFKELFFINTDKLSLSKEGTEIFIRNFNQLVNSFVKSRIKEGKELEKDIKKRLKKLEKNIADIEKKLPEIKNNAKLRIKKRLSEIFEKENINGRLEQEVVYFIDKIDVSEEITRFKAHLKNIQDIIDKGEQSGKKLDFYTQELLREINTLSVKSQDAQISKIAVDIKSEIEKIREQVQNVE